MGGGAQAAAGRGPEPGLSRPCPSDSSMEALTLNLTEVVKRQNPKSKKGFNQVRTPLSPPPVFGRPWRGSAPVCAHARVRRCGCRWVGTRGKLGCGLGCPRCGVPSGQMCPRAKALVGAGGALGAERTAPCRGPGASQWGRGPSLGGTCCFPTWGGWRPERRQSLMEAARPLPELAVSPGELLLGWPEGESRQGLAIGADGGLASR